MAMMMELDETGGRKKETEGTLPPTHGTFKCIRICSVCSVFGQGKLMVRGFPVLPLLPDSHNCSG